MWTQNTPYINKQRNKQNGLYYDCTHRTVVTNTRRCSTTNWLLQWATIDLPRPLRTLAVTTMTCRISTRQATRCWNMPLDSVYVFPACNRLSRVISEMSKCRYYSHYNEVITTFLCMKVIDLTCPLFVAFPECTRRQDEGSDQSHKSSKSRYWIGKECWRPVHLVWQQFNNLFHTVREFFSRPAQSEGLLIRITHYFVVWRSVRGSQ